jgi:tetratricopeptide (TPR) repeat protein
MIETLARMEIKDQTSIDEITGREIALREGIGLLVVPGISEAGNQYAITARIINTETGDNLKSEVLYARTQDEILPAIDNLSRKIRRDLGESRYQVSLQDKPLAKVTTSSLEALQQYSLGIESHIFADFINARKYYENALAIDTGFTSAKASLGNILMEKYNDTEGKKLLEEAVRDAGSLTDREKYGIIAFHAEHVENDYDKAIANMDILKRLYPDDPTVHNNLGWYHQQSGQYELALKEYKTAVCINPDLALSYAAILWIYEEYLGKIDSLIVWAEKMISDNPENPWGYMHMGSAWFCRDSIARAIGYYRKAARLNPDFVLNQYRLAHAYRRLENYPEAMTVLREIISGYPAEAPAYYNLGVNNEAMGNLPEARDNFLIFRKIAEEKWTKAFPDYYGTYTSLAAVTARLGEMDISRQMLHKAKDLDSSQYYSFAGVFCVQGNIPGTLENIDLALENGYRNLYMLKASPDLSALQFDIRFQALLDKYFNRH